MIQYAIWQAGEESYKLGLLMPSIWKASFCLFSLSITLGLARTGRWGAGSPRDTGTGHCYHCRALC